MSLQHLVLLLILLTSCDPAPLRRNDTGDDLVQDPGTIGVTDPSGSEGIIETDLTASTPIAGGGTLGDGFEHCTFSNVQSSLDLGNVSACLNTNDQQSFLVKFTREDAFNRVCLVPMHIMDSGNSFHLSTTIPCGFQSDDRYMKGQFIKNRPGPYYNPGAFLSYEINGVMVIKDMNNAVNDFFYCMNSPDGLMEQNCNWFYSNHINHFVQIPFY